MNEITKSNNTNLIQSIDDVKSIADVMAKTGVFGTNPGEAIVKIMAGRELGIGPFASMTNIYMVKGRPSMSANLLAAKVKASGKYNYRVVELSDNICRLAWYENGTLVGENSFSREDAKRAGTQNVDRFPQNMLFARALSNGVRFHAPDVFFGVSMYVPEELADQGEQGEAEEPYVLKGELVVDKATGEVVTAEPVAVPAAASAKSSRPYGPAEFKDAYMTLTKRVLANNHLDQISVDDYNAVGHALAIALPRKDEAELVLFALTTSHDLEKIEKHYIKAFMTVMDVKRIGDVPSSISQDELRGFVKSLKPSADLEPETEIWPGDDDGE